MQLRWRCSCAGDAAALVMHLRWRCSCAGDAAALAMQLRWRCSCADDAAALAMQLRWRWLLVACCWLLAGHTDGRVNLSLIIIALKKTGSWRKLFQPIFDNPKGIVLCIVKDWLKKFSTTCLLQIIIIKLKLTNATNKSLGWCLIQTQPRSDFFVKMCVFFEDSECLESSILIKILEKMLKKSKSRAMWPSNASEFCARMEIFA